MRLTKKLRNVGIHYAKNPSQRRSIYLSNTISLIIALLGLIMFTLYQIWFGWNVITATILAIPFLSLSTLLLNYLNLSELSRLWMCLFLPLTVMGLSLYSKTIYYYRQEELDYFTFRIVILSCCVLPPVFFSTKEKFMLILTSTIILTILMLHDPLHNYFNVPYPYNNLKGSNFAFTNIVVFIMYMLMTIAVVYMKWLSEKNESKALALIQELHNINKKLHDKNDEVALQNQEIIKQSQNINISQHRLTEAYKIIEEQRNILYKQNKHLSSELIEKNRELTETNTELIKHNNELRQFSYTVSHNLRGPVASLIGLLQLFNEKDLSIENQEIYNHILSSTVRLDNIIKDLSKIIDIRHDIFQIRQKIYTTAEVNEILQVLKREIEMNEMTVKLDVSKLPILYSVKPMVHSILYNLVSNAIKYRSPDRKPEIEIRAHEEGRYYVIEIRDNGLGIDMKRDKENLFKLYKRFHHHTEGKGLGLYLVKLQAEALGGTIEVDSVLYQYTSFIVKLRKPENAERQILYHKNYAEIFFDANLNCIGTIWQIPFSNEQFNSVLKKFLEFVKVYNTPNYLTDLSPKDLQEDDRKTFFIDCMTEASKCGLTRIAVVQNDLTGEVYSDDVLEALIRVGITLSYFSSQPLAVEWIDNQNEEALIRVKR